MSRNLRLHEREKLSKARRTFALERVELRQPSAAREPAVGAVSHAVKVMDPASASAIEAFLKKKGQGA